jgi:hypothetical protein
MRYVVAKVALIVSVIAVGCGPKAGPSEGAPAATESPVHDVMRQKLACGHSILEGLAQADFPRIETNARRLHSISREAGWLVHDTVTYFVLSEEFRDIADQMAEGAAREDLEAVTEQYVAMVATCVECHAYVRRERLTKDFPGRVSRLETAPHPALALAGPLRPVSPRASEDADAAR